MPLVSESELRDALTARLRNVHRLDVWRGPDHDGDASIWVRIVIPDDDPRFDSFWDRVEMRREVEDVTRKLGLADLVYVTFRGVVEDRDLAASERL